MILKNMAFEELTNAASNLPGDLAIFAEWMVLFTKAAGVMLIIYFIYLIITGIITYQRAQRLKRVEKKMEALDTKLDYIIKSLAPKKRKKATKEK